MGERIWLPLSTRDYTEHPLKPQSQDSPECLRYHSSSLSHLMRLIVSDRDSFLTLPSLTAPPTCSMPAK